MSFPPPNGPPGSDASGPSGFGPPQGFGPPEPPAPPGYGPPAPPGGFGQPPGGPPGPYGPPPPGGGGGGNGGKIAAAIVGAVLVVGLLIGGVLVLGGGDDEENKASDDTSQSADTEDGSESGSDPSSEPPNESAGPNEPAPPDASRAPDGPPTGSEPFPFVVLDPGQCYDHPALSSDVQEIKIRSCSEPHNGEVISNATLTGDYATEKDLQQEVLRLCKADASERLKELSPDGRTYYFYAIYPQLPTYENRGKDTISCSITLSNAPDGPKLQKPLPE